MEMHRRSKAPPNNEIDNNNTNSSGSTKRNGSGSSVRSKHHSRPGNPYTAASQTTTTDIVLFRSIQILLAIAVCWFLSLIISVDSPASNGDALRGSGSAPITTVLDPKDIADARDQITKVREEFYTRYGGKSEALAMLNRGLRTFENEKAAKNMDSVRFTADRYLRSIVRYEEKQSSSALQQAEFIMAFGGYSVTVGRGNHFEQSYPFVMEKVLAPILALPPFGVKLVVRNSAIGGIPSFPYGWCLPNFLGEDADAVSWDYGMNEGNGAAGLESYVRQALMMPKSPPLFILLDMKRPRLDLLQKYVNLGFLPDPVALGGRDSVNKKLLQLPETNKPPGLQKWDEWGAPKGSPGQSPWHPKKMEHELMGWMMAMHMIDAVEAALNVMEEDPNWREIILQQNPSLGGKLPSPKTDVEKTGAVSILHGAPSNDDSSKWSMNRVSCRTSFLPNMFGNFNSIIQSGVTKDEDDMLQSRDDSLFNGGWVMDVGKVERETKVKVQKYGGLGYIDMKTALYGIPSSGTLKLWLPYELSATNPVQSTGDVLAEKYFNSVVLCEVNEKRGDKECNMLSDLAFEVGNVAVAKAGVTQIKGVASYLKKDICIRLDIPNDAKLSTKGSDFGLPVDITVTGSDVSRENGACSISHVIWEHNAG
eukprot:CAMPEP_0201737230 /NCGR_PEP_ID=MMETSP0593-20130828/41821_1 /ASSEMBLY_ACC=CAM_ASM_000672 /TAXON_ID=267983 /ORGANISM="Skeletonema japonicum, Strain CCMP2506" /LENGTH=648 /DNA_ID=CAMNT_0048231169 /DNA_START=156 /DNA_END=2102 /DNA_ORIENTATION=-